MPNRSGLTVARTVVPRFAVTVAAVPVVIAIGAWQAGGAPPGPRVPATPPEPAAPVVPPVPGPLLPAVPVPLDPPPQAPAKQAIVKSVNSLVFSLITGGPPSVPRDPLRMPVGTAM